MSASIPSTPPGLNRRPTSSVGPATFPRFESRRRDNSISSEYVNVSDSSSFMQEVKQRNQEVKHMVHSASTPPRRQPLHVAARSPGTPYVLAPESPHRQHQPNHHYQAHRHQQQQQQQKQSFSPASSARRLPVSERKSMSQQEKELTAKITRFTRELTQLHTKMGKPSTGVKRETNVSASTKPENRKDKDAPAMITAKELRRIRRKKHRVWVELNDTKRMLKDIEESWDRLSRESILQQAFAEKNRRLQGKITRMASREKRFFKEKYVALRKKAAELCPDHFDNEEEPEVEFDLSEDDNTKPVMPSVARALKLADEMAEESWDTPDGPTKEREEWDRSYTSEDFYSLEGSTSDSGEELVGPEERPGLALINNITRLRGHGNEWPMTEGVPDGPSPLDINHAAWEDRYTDEEDGDESDGTNTTPCPIETPVHIDPELAKANAQNKKLQRDLTKLRKKLSSVRHIAKSQSTDFIECFRNMQEEEDDLRRQLEDREQQLASRMVEINDLQKDLQTLQSEEEQNRQVVEAARENEARMQEMEAIIGDYPLERGIQIARSAEPPFLTTNHPRGEMSASFADQYKRIEKLLRTSESDRQSVTAERDEALRRAEALEHELNISKKELAHAMTDASNASAERFVIQGEHDAARTRVDELERALNLSKEEIALLEKYPATNTNPSQSTVDHNGECDEALKRAQSVEQELTSMRGEIAQRETDARALQDASEALMHDLRVSEQRMKDDIEVMNKELARALKTIEDKDALLAAAEIRNGTLATQKPDLEAKMKTLQAKHETLAMEDAEAHASKMRELVTRAETAERHLRESEAQLATSDSRIARLAAEVKNVDAEIEDIRNDMEASSAERRISEKQQSAAINQLMERVDLAERGLDEKDRRLDQAVVAEETYRAQVDALQSQLAAAEQAHQAQVSTLETRHETEIAALKSAHAAEAASRQFVRDTLQDEINSLTSEQADAKKEVHRLRTQRDHFRQECEYYKASLANHIKKSEGALIAARAELDKVTREAAILADENKGLNTQLEDAAEKLKEAGDVDIKRMVDVLASENMGLRTNIDILKMDCENFVKDMEEQRQQHAAEISSLRATKTSLQTQIKELKKQIIHNAESETLKFSPSRGSSRTPTALWSHSHPSATSSSPPPPQVSTFTRISLGHSEIMTSSDADYNKEAAIPSAAGPV
ncbi:hypothetical protein DFJ77DRAFT_460567 [Powellomyces hirtus]|nr:hypothetical protein DFJ77DRAFT_460567 [Powellomyces hirtus]